MKQIQIEHSIPVQPPGILEIQGSPTKIWGCFSEVDITPWANLPKAGYSTMAQSAKGFRGKLKARIYKVRKEREAPIYMIQLDLLSGSYLLHSKLIEKNQFSLGITSDRLVLLSTHTHSGPSGYFSSAFYNRYTGNESGFNEELFQFLIKQIQSGIDSCRDREVPIQIKIASTSVYGATRNRSLLPHYKNFPYLQGEATTEKEFQSIPPELVLMRFDTWNDDGTSKPIAGLYFFSIHGTVISSHSEEFSSDIWGFVQEDVKIDIKNHYKINSPFIFSGAESTHGDITPALERGKSGFSEAKRLSKLISSRISKLFTSMDQSRGMDDPEFKTAWKEILPKDKANYQGFSLCEDAKIGMSLTAGAKDNETPILSWLPPFAPGYPRYIFTGNCHREKRHLFSFVHDWIFPKEEFPQMIPIQIIQMGNFSLVPLPFEVTFASGNRIQNRLKDALRELRIPTQTIVVSSVANDYIGYATTAEEYSMQYYEGGHTLFGPDTTNFIAESIYLLAKDWREKSRLVYKSGSYQFNLPEFQNPTLSDSDTPILRKEISKPLFLDATNKSESHWTWDWMDEKKESIQWNDPLVQIELYSFEEKKWKFLFGDESPRLGIYWVKDTSDGSIYRVKFFDPEWDPKLIYRYKVLPRKGHGILYSKPFPDPTMVPHP